jgi:hypothetical protein
MGYGAQMSAFGGNSFEQLSVCFAPGWANSFGRTHRPRPGLRLLHTQEPGAGSRPTPSGCCGVHGEAEGEQICRGEIHLISQSHTESVPRKPAPRRDRGQGATDALLQESNTWERMAAWEDKTNPAVKIPDS